MTVAIKEAEVSTGKRIIRYNKEIVVGTARYSSSPTPGTVLAVYQLLKSIQVRKEDTQLIKTLFGMQRSAKIMITFIPRVWCQAVPRNLLQNFE